MRKIAFFAPLVAVVTAAVGTAVAQDAPSAPSFDLTVAETAATTIATSVSDLITNTVAVQALIVLGALVGLWLLFKLPRWLGLGRK